MAKSKVREGKNQRTFRSRSGNRDKAWGRTESDKAARTGTPGRAVKKRRSGLELTQESRHTPDPSPPGQMDERKLGAARPQPGLCTLKRALPGSKADLMPLPPTTTPVCCGETSLRVGREPHSKSPLSLAPLQERGHWETEERQAHGGSQVWSQGWQ